LLACSHSPPLQLPWHWQQLFSIHQKLFHKYQAMGATQFPRQVAYLGILMAHIKVRAQLRAMKKAAGLNTCLNQLNQLIPNNRADLATKQDLEILLKRQRELNQQLRELNERVDTPPATK
jgi:hypothetical protein